MGELSEKLDSCNGNEICRNGSRHMCETVRVRQLEKEREKAMDAMEVNNPIRDRDGERYIYI